MFSYALASCYAALHRLFGVSQHPDSAQVFLVGYVGGAVLARLLGTADDAAKFQVTVLTRSAAKAKQLEVFGVRAVVGSLDDLAQLEATAAASDVVIECADADHIASTKAFLAGLKRRHESTGRLPVLIHTVRDPVISDNAGGMYGSDTIYYDSDTEQLDAIPITQPHRNVDLAVIAADKAGTALYGLASGPLVDAKIVNERSQQIPALIKASMDRRQAGMVGKGKNFHPNVHIDDLSLLYRTILDAGLSGADIGHGREGFYFGENGEHTMYDIATAMGAALKELQLAPTAEPSSFTEEELKKYFSGSDNLGTNVRCRAERARAIGWKPLKTTEDMLASIKPEIEHIPSTGITSLE
ncbi:NAD-P-binding protein [Trametes elegans]|nr:NAD-P-binding protein [Trametes elegans]